MSQSIKQITEEAYAEILKIFQENGFHDPWGRLGDSKYVTPYERVKKIVESKLQAIRTETLEPIKNLENKQLMLMRDDEALPVILWKDIEEAIDELLED